MVANPRSERVRGWLALGRRSARQRAGRFLVEGPQAVREALRAGAAVELIVDGSADGQARHAELVTLADGAGVRVSAVSAEVVAALSETVHTQGVFALCRLLGGTLDEVAADGANSRGLVAVLSRVRDPGNAGTVIRVADAAGADGVVLTDESVDPHNPKAVRASAGSVFHLPVVAGPTLPVVVERLRASGLAVLAADGRPDAADLDDLLDDAGRGQGPLAGPTAWVFGNEAWGLPDEDLAHVDHVVRVPIHGQAESLNLATAAAVCLYASARARRVA